MFRYVCFLAVVLCCAPFAEAQRPGARQYYTPWTKHSSKPYYYRYYYYKASPTARDYSYHYGIYHPSYGKRVYMYNPHARRYWGYWQGDRYSLLPEDKRKDSLEEIPAEDFPAPGAAPRMPDSDDGTLLLAPPVDFPGS